MKTRMLWIAAAIALAIALWLLFGPRDAAAPQSPGPAPTSSSSATHPRATGTTQASTPTTDDHAHADPAEPAPATRTTLPAGRWTGSEPTSAASREAAQWRPVLQTFAREFPDISPGWAQRLARWTTPELAATLTYADPRTAPQGTVAGEPVTLAESSTMADVKVTYSSGEAYVIRLQMLPQGWRVAQLNEAR